MLILKLFCVAILVPSIKPTPVKTVSKLNDVNYRLPLNVVPTNYAIELTLGDFSTTDATALIINGNAVITLITTETVQQIVLHGNKLNVLKVELKALEPEGGSEDDPPIEQPDLDPNDSYECDEITDKIVINTLTPLDPTNVYQLTITFTGQLRDDEMYGFYKSTYTDQNKETKALATTQFQPTYARRAFPCFDEPGFKAAFDITLIYPDKYTAIGNAAVKSDDPIEGNLKKTVFHTTPKMSSYLVAFVISEFTPSNDNVNLEEDKIPHKVWSRDEAASTRNLASTVTPKIIQDLAEYTGVPYSTSTLTKLDQVAIPDFSAGAMENWGLVTYRETALLWDENESSNRYKQRVETVIAHELAHMWFGNLKTTHWWSDLWLNEGFATYFEFHSTGRVEENWELDKQFVVEDVHSALASDASTSSHALNHKVNSPAEISGRFSTISYAKGGSILRMVEHILGSVNFENGIKSYAKSNHFGDATTTDLWQNLASFAGSNLPTTLAEVMDNWTNKPGYPLVKVSANGNDVRLSQKRFLTSTGTEDDTKWHVPISYTTSLSSSEGFENTKPTAWISLNDNLQINGVLENADWIVINNKQTGFYRVQYDDVLLEKLGQALKQDEFSSIIDLNRANFVDDLLILARINEYQYARVFELLSFLKNDVSYYPWYAALAEFDVMLRRTGDERIRGSLSVFILDLMAKLIESVPFDDAKDDDQINTHARVLAQTWACKLGDETCISKATEEFAKYQSSEPKKRPDKNMKLIVYCNALRHSTNAKEDWEFLWNEYKNSDLATEQVTIISALGCTRDTALLNEYLKKTITPDGGIRKQDALSVYSAVHSGNPEGVDIAFKFLTENYDAIADYYKSLNSLSSLITGIVAKFNKQSQIDALKTFINELSEEDKGTAQNALASAERNLEWTTSFEKQMTDFFNEDDGNNNANSVKFGVLTLVTLTIFHLFY